MEAFRYGSSVVTGENEKALYVHGEKFQTAEARLDAGFFVEAKSGFEPL